MRSRVTQSPLRIPSSIALMASSFGKFRQFVEPA
jgi:hypothetical protein